MATSKFHAEKALARLAAVHAETGDANAQQREAWLAHLGAVDQRDLDGAVDHLSRRRKAWPGLPDLLEAVEDCRRHREQRAASTGGSDFIARAANLGFNAVRLSQIGHSLYGAVAAAAGTMGDQRLMEALQWVELHRQPWAAGARQDPEAVRTNARLIDEIRAAPELHFAPAAMIELLTASIARAVEGGWAPPDVAIMYGPRNDEPAPAP